MRLLLDTHALLWWLAGDESLSQKAQTAIDAWDSVVFVSAASVWEIGAKYRIGKLPDAHGIVGRLETVLAEQDFGELAVSVAHGEQAGALPGLFAPSTAC